MSIILLKKLFFTISIIHIFYSCSDSQSLSPEEIIEPKIVFTSDRDGNQEIYSMNLDGSDQINLTNSPYDDNEPSWSPNGNQIVFTSVRETNGYLKNDIFIMTGNGNGLKNLTKNFGGANKNPSFSSDGSIILFKSLVKGGYKLCSTDLNGNITVLTGDQANPGISFFSHDGSYIIFENQWSPRGIHRIDADGNNFKLLNSDHSIIYKNDFDINMNGQIVYYHRVDFYLMDYEGNTQLITTDSTRGYNPIFTKDGQNILNFSGLGVFELDYKKNMRNELVTMESLPIGLAVSKSKIFICTYSDPNSDIFSINTDGSDLKNLTDNFSVNFEPSIHPDL